MPSGGILTAGPFVAAVHLLPQNPAARRDLVRENKGHFLSRDGSTQRRAAPFKTEWLESGPQARCSPDCVLEKKSGRDQHLKRLLVFKIGLGETYVHTETYVGG